MFWFLQSLDMADSHSGCVCFVYTFCLQTALTVEYVALIEVIYDDINLIDDEY